MEAKDLLNLEIEKKIEKELEKERQEKILTREGKIKENQNRRYAQVGNLDNFSRINRMGERGRNEMFNMDSEEDHY